VLDEVSNWYVRRSRRRFWVAAAGDDKRAAFYALYQTLVTTARLMAPAAPFIADRLYRDLVGYAEPDAPPSVHLADFPEADTAQIDTALERSMTLAMQAVSLGRAARATAQIKVRQPLANLVVVVGSDADVKSLAAVTDLVSDEVNTRNVELSTDAQRVQQVRVSPQFPKLGPVFGKKVNEVAGLLKALSAEEAARFKSEGKWQVQVDGGDNWVTHEMVTFESDAAEGWSVASEGAMTAAVDTRLDDELVLDGLARELVNRIQNMRKEAGFAVTDRIALDLQGPPKVLEAFEKQRSYILQETLTVEASHSGQPGEFRRSWPLAGGEVTLSVARAKVVEQRAQ
jgi:isoleucyl-tRNA synthetase